MITEYSFNREFRYQVNQLGNLVRGLELVVEYVRSHQTRGARHALAQDCRRILASVPRQCLSQALLKFASPGVPDIYQGCERWNLSLVDPDNRRAVDHAVNRESLRAMQASATGEGGLAAPPYERKIKQVKKVQTLKVACPAFLKLEESPEFLRHEL